MEEVTNSVLLWPRQPGFSSGVFYLLFVVRVTPIIYVVTVIFLLELVSLVQLLYFSPV